MTGSARLERGARARRSSSARRSARRPVAAHGPARAAARARRRLRDRRRRRASSRRRRSSPRALPLLLVGTPDRLRQRVEPAVALRRRRPVPGRPPGVGASGSSSGARRSARSSGRTSSGRAASVAMALGLPRAGRRLPRPDRASSGPRRSCRSFVLRPDPYALADRPRPTGRATTGDRGARCDDPPPAERARRDRGARHRPGRDGPDHDDDAAAHDRPRPRPGGGRARHQRPHVRDVRAVADLGPADRPVRQRPGRSSPGWRSRAVAAVLAAVAPARTAACSCSSPCSCSATAGTSATSRARAADQRPVARRADAASRASTDALIWSSAAARQPRLGRRRRGGRATRRSGLLGAALVVVPAGCGRRAALERSSADGRRLAHAARAPRSRRRAPARPTPRATRAQASTSSSGTCSSALWATFTSPGPEDHARRVALVDEQPHVGAVRLAEQRRAATRDRLGGVGEPDRQRVVRRHARRPELPAGDLDRRRVVAQERVRGVGRVDRPPQVGLRVRRRLAEPDAVPAVGDDPVEDGRRPLAAATRCRRSSGTAGRGPSSAGRSRPRCGRVSSASSARRSTYRLSSADTPSRRCDACAARPGTVSRNVIAPAWATTMSRFDGSVMIARSPVDAGPDRGERALAAVLLGRHERDDELAVERARARRVATSARTAPRIAATPPFMSQAPRPYRRAVADLGRPTDRPSTSRDRPAARRRGGRTGRSAGRPARPTRPMTTGRLDRGVSSPGQAGSARIAAGSGSDGLDRQPGVARAAAARSAATASSEPVMLGIRTSAARSARSAAGSTARISRHVDGGRVYRTAFGCHRHLP